LARKKSQKGGAHSVNRFFNQLPGKKIKECKKGDTKGQLVERKRKTKKKKNPVQSTSDE